MSQISRRNYLKHFLPSGATTVTGTSATVGGGVLASTSVRTEIGATGTVAGGGTLASTSVRTELGATGAVAGGGVLASTSVTTVLGVAAFAGGGSVDATSTDVITGIAAVDGGGSLDATGTAPSQAVPTGAGKVRRRESSIPKAKPKRKHVIAIAAADLGELQVHSRSRVVRHRYGSGRSDLSGIAVRAEAILEYRVASSLGTFSAGARADITFSLRDDDNEVFMLLGR